MKNILITTGPGAVKSDVFISTVNWNLKSYHQKYGLSRNDYHWLNPVLIDTFTSLEINLKYLSDIIETNEVDILGFSMYVWDYEYFANLADQIKKKYPEILIVAGGPQIDVHINPEFFSSMPFVDYAFYGEAEIAFTRLIDYLQGYNVELVNVASKDKVFDHEIFNDKEHLNESPLHNYLQEYENYVIDLKKRFGDKNLIAVWETVKGCPFSCSFCDWQSGLHNKVRIWAKTNNQPSWQKELDVFTKLQIKSVVWTNPNQGMQKQDHDIIDYWCKLAAAGLNPPKNAIPQTSKQKTKEGIELLKKQFKYGVCDRFKFDIQCTNETVLKNIDRPQLPWPELKMLLKDLLDQFPNLGREQINVIWPLPGQTLDILRHNMMEIGSLGLFANCYPWQILPLSPAGKSEYQDKFKIKTKKGNFFEYYQGTTNWVTSTYSATEKEVFIGNFIIALYSALYYSNFNVIGKEKYFFDNIKNLRQLVEPSWNHWQTKNELRILIGKNPITFGELVQIQGPLIYKKIVV